MSFRVGIGYDAHRLVPGRRLVLGGVDIPHETGLLGHSDADVLSHAIGDALLGALGEGDLGRHFPPGDPKWKDASSLELLGRILDIVRGRGGRIVNVDATLVLESPKVAPHVPAMRAALAGALAVDDARISIKATTNEGLDAVGRGEGAVAHAVVLLELKGEV
jgi:2-C-methyl-D-erythritol 2,4-cyclodiphosphate synthase